VVGKRFDIGGKPGRIASQVKDADVSTAFHTVQNEVVLRVKRVNALMRTRTHQLSVLG
jgi:hypothetical protein